jgi:aminoglycoside phosphotransferase (APT) family kinase protein
MDIVEQLPDPFRALLGPVEWTERPPQGATSQVQILGGSRGVFVVKRASRPPFDAWLRREAAVLRALEPGGLPAPRVVDYVEREQDQGREHWLLMTRLPGEPLSALLARPLAPGQRRTLLRGFGALLADLHRRPAPAELVPPGGDWLAHALQQAGDYLSRYQVDGSPELLERLRSHPPAPVASALIHGDCTLDNVLAEGGRISGVIDWFGGAQGDPRYDLALATQPVEEAFQQPDDLEAFYAGYGGPRLTPEEADYFVGLYEFF